jgi:hypothetical protein
VTQQVVWYIAIFNAKMATKRRKKKKKFKVSKKTSKVSPKPEQNRPKKKKSQQKSSKKAVSRIRLTANRTVNHLAVSKIY